MVPISTFMCLARPNCCWSLRANYTENNQNAQGHVEPQFSAYIPIFIGAALLDFSLRLPSATQAKVAA
jgi:hypothetical protein